MRLLHFLTAGVLLILFSGLVRAQPGHADGVDLTTIQAPWSLRILGNDLDITKAQVKPDQQSAYFMMTSESKKLNVSVFIEPVKDCRSSEKCRDHVLQLGNPGWGQYQDLRKGKIKDFYYFEFFRPAVNGRPLKVLDMYAQYVADGYWVDLHISKVLYDKTEHVLFENVVNSVAFVPKGGATTTPFDTQAAAGRRAADSWLELWDNNKCRESHVALSSLTRADNPESGWIDYCRTANKYFGKKKSRNLVGSAFTSSLPGKTERPVAILAYHSDFANRSTVVEIIALMLEKDGRWIVTNYLPQ